MAATAEILAAGYFRRGSLDGLPQEHFIDGAGGL
jgi:hypothetical protein